MKDEPDNQGVPFPARLLTGALVPTGVMLVALLNHWPASVEGGWTQLKPV
jgi:hypothetical protein